MTIEWPPPGNADELLERITCEFAALRRTKMLRRAMHARHEKQSSELQCVETRREQVVTLRHWTDLD